MITSNINDWLDNAFEQLDEFGQAQEIHVNNFAKINEVLPDKNSLLHKGIFIFNEGCEKITSQNRLGLQIDLRIALKENSNQLIGVPENSKQLIDALGDFYFPEIVLFKPILKPFFPVIEYYASPLPFEIPGIFSGSKIIYE